MSERDRKESEDQDFGSDDVEAHIKKQGPSAAMEPGGDDGDEVEAHIKKQGPSAAIEPGGDDGDEVEAHIKGKLQS